MNVSTPAPRPTPAPVPATSPAPVSGAPTTPERVVVVGAGPAGMATAIELAQQGVRSVVLEKRGGPASRENLFAVAGPFADRLAALDPEGSLTKLLVPTDSAISEDATAGTRNVRPFSGGLQADPARSRGDMDALLRAAGSPKAPDADTRQWSKVPIGDLEEGMRILARTKHADMIELRQDADVEKIRQGDGWAEAVLASNGAGGAVDAVRGAMLVDATGADLLGGPRTVYPEQSHWIGGRFAPPAEQSTANLRHRAQTPDAPVPVTTIRLRQPDRTLVWAQVGTDPRAMTNEERTTIVERRAREVGVEGGLTVEGRTAPVTVQLWTSNEPARGRVLKVGDSVRAPYFPTSTGAAAALVHDAPRAADAIVSVLNGAPVEQTTTAYADAVRGANERLLQLSRTAMLGDLGRRIADGAAPIVEERAGIGSHASPQVG